MIDTETICFFFNAQVVHGRINVNSGTVFRDHIIHSPAVKNKNQDGRRQSDNPRPMALSGGMDDINGPTHARNPFGHKKLLESSGL
jgi:hypothetical protein